MFFSFLVVSIFVLSVVLGDSLGWIASTFGLVSVLVLVVSLMITSEQMHTETKSHVAVSKPKRRRKPSTKEFDKVFREVAAIIENDELNA